MGECIDSLGVGDEFIDLLAPVWMGQYEKSYELAHGARELLEYLGRKGVRMGIVSNNSPKIRDQLARLGLIGYFEAIIISEEIDLFKPDPRILLHACDQLGVKPKEAMYVGDHPFDVVCASEASVKAVWIPINEFMKLPTDSVAPELRLNRLTDLIGVL